MAFSSRDTSSAGPAEPSIRAALLATLSDNVPEVLSAKDAEGRYVFVNSRFEELHSVSLDEVAGRTDLEAFPPELAEELRANDSVVLESGEATSSEDSVTHEDGPHTYSTLKVPLRDADGAVVGVCAVSTDVTERRRHEHQVRHQHDEIVRLARERGRLVAQVLQAEERTRRRVAQSLHDDALQSLLAAHQELLEAAPGSIGVQRAHDVVSSAIARLREAVIALHPVTLEQGGLEAALAAVAGQAERQGEFRCSVRVEAEAVGLQDELILSIARELLTNAVKHAGASRVSVAVIRDADGLLLEVADDGRGMAAGRRDDALREGHVGLASITQRLEAIGGRFVIDSTPGKGTVARAWMPVLATAE